ncbi:hypothetical protein ACFV6F_40330 [Kitasatospora phosalacinea]|uniref:hypothetical protein n=1 Tax=Kitasatospora phosalacinea TaxID=2065 RepID=UPI0036480007
MRAPYPPAPYVEGVGAIAAPVVELGCTTPTRPAVLTGRAQDGAEHDPGYRYLFMPLRSA